jgi:predicted permease
VLLPPYVCSSQSDARLTTSQALLFSKVAFSLTPEKLKELWIIPLSFVVVTTVSAIVAYSLAKLFRIKRRSHVAFAIACGCFANSVRSA